MAYSLLFDQGVSDSQGRVSINRILGGQSNEIVIGSDRIAHFAIHYFGRAYICPGKRAGCPACGRSPSRFLALLCSGVPGHTMLTEIGQATLDIIVRAKDTKSIERYAGTKWKLSRSATKRPLFATYIETVPTSRYFQVPDRDFISAIARIYSLPRPSVGTTWETWPEQVGQSLVENLERCFVKMPGSDRQINA
jgi:hypothetical protein